MAEKGKLCSDTGFKPIMDANECRIASETLGFQSVEGVNHDNLRPSGCNHISLQNPTVDAIFFNTNTNNGRNPTATPLCQKGICFIGF